jgi:sugar transferase (PEP-CTERM/EpsH1 system associated)
MLPNVLYVVHRVPYPPDKGDRIRAFHLLRFLERRSNVHLACLADEPVEESTVAFLKQRCQRLAIVPTGRWARWWRAIAALGTGRSASEGAFASRALRHTIRAWTKKTRFHAALASSSAMAPYLRLPDLATTSAVVDLVDLDSQKWFDYAQGSRGIKRWLYRVEGSRLRRFERTIACWAHALTLVSEAEAELYRQCCGKGPVYAIGNGVDLDFFAMAPPASEPTCVFVGALDYRPNVEGACWFCREVWPAIRQVRPDARLTLVGRKPVATVRRLVDIAGVTVVGQVPDVRPYLVDAAVVVVPLGIARGIQNKVLEALAMGRATVASAQALEGLKLVPGRDAISATSAREWQEAVVSLLADGRRRRLLGEAGRRYVEQHHRWESCLRPMQQVLSLGSAL